MMIDVEEYSMISAESYFDGRSFESLDIVVERVHDDLPEMREEMTQKPWKHGSFVNGLTLNSRQITLECRYLGDKWQSFEELKDALADWIITEEDRKLQLRTHPGQYYLAHYLSFVEGDRVGGSGIGGFELNFTASDPIRYGEERSYVTGSQSADYFEVAGNERASMVITVRNAIASGGIWSLTCNDYTMSVDVGNSYPSTIVFDCVNRVVKVDGNIRGVTLGSKWPTFEPGRWFCRVSRGSGTATFSWTQRYR